jgi:hypothetical protein
MKYLELRKRNIYIDQNFPLQMPELNGHSGKHRSALLQLLLQLFGLLSGFAIMLTIALYENELSEVLQSLL